MASYISSNANRFYTAIESSFGTVGSLTAINRIPALKLTVQQQLDTKDRKDKTGSRTFSGIARGWQTPHQFRAADIPDELGQVVGRSGIRPFISSGAGRDPVAVCRRDGNQQLPPAEE